MKKWNDPLQNKSLYTLAQGLLLFVALVLMILALRQKSGIFLDEFFSYGCSNSANSHWLLIEDEVPYASVKEVYDQYLTVSESERFHYNLMWKTQSDIAGTHPPLFYFLLHTVCSLTPGVFSIWQVGVINILIGLLTIFLLGRILLRMTGSPLAALLGQFLFLVQPGFLNSVIYLRMYAAAMCVLTALTLHFLKLADKTPTLADYFLLLLLSVTAAMTQYYCLIFLFFLSFVHGIHLLIQKRWKQTAAFIGTMILAGGSTVLIFPAILGHLFSGSRSQEAFSNMSGNSSGSFLDRINNFTKIYGHNILHTPSSRATLYFLGILFLLLLAAYCLRKKFPSGKDLLYFHLLIPAVGYLVAVAKIAPYGVNRYLMPMYAVGFAAEYLVAVKAVSLFIESPNLRKILILFGFIPAILLAISIPSANLECQYRGFGEKMKVISGAEYDRCDVYYVYDWNMPQLYQALYDTGHDITFHHIENDTVPEFPIPKEGETILLLIADGNCTTSDLSSLYDDSFTIVNLRQYAEEQAEHKEEYFGLNYQFLLVSR